MTIYDLDTSGLIKRYVTEAGSSGVQQLFQDKQDHLFLTSRLTMPETYSAFARRLREGSVSAVDYQVNLQAFQLHSATSYRFIELTEEVVHISRRLLEQYPLRANDCGAVGIRIGGLSNLAKCPFAADDFPCGRQSPTHCRDRGGTIGPKPQ